MSAPENVTDVTATTREQLWLNPVPDWETATAVWGVAWPMHTYILATAFLCMGMATCILLWRFLSVQRSSIAHKATGQVQKSSGLPPPVLILLAIATFLRALILFVDPYRSRQKLPVVVVRTLAHFPFTCFLAAYHLFYLALSSSLKVRVESFSWLHKRSVIAAVVTGFMLFNTAVDIALVLAATSRALLVVCTVANALWATVIAAELTTIVLRLWSRHKQMMEAIRLSMSKHDVDPHEDRRDSVRSCRPLTLFTQDEDSRGIGVSSSPLLKAIRMVLFLLFSMVAYMPFQLYYLLGVVGAFSFDSLIHPWRWYVFATLHRLSELQVVLVILLSMSLTSGPQARAARRASHSAGKSTRLLQARPKGVVCDVDKKNVAECVRASPGTDIDMLPGPSV